MGALTLYNRRLGGLAVDGMLRSVGRAISLESPSFETAARISGGVFRVLALNSTPFENEQMIARIKSNISTVKWHGGALSPRIDTRLFEDRNLHPSDLFSPPVRPTRGQNRYRSGESGRKEQAHRINIAYPHIYERAGSAVEQGVSPSNG